jgi:hypothetical protein
MTDVITPAKTLTICLKFDELSGKCPIHSKRNPKLQHDKANTWQYRNASLIEVGTMLNKNNNHNNHLPTKMYKNARKAHNPIS